jgi:integrase
MQSLGRISPSNWRRLFRDTRTAAEVTSWPPDCLRHSFGTYWLEKFKDAPRLAIEMGNSVPVILKRYHKALDDPEDANRFWSIEPKTGSEC